MDEKAVPGKIHMLYPFCTTLVGEPSRGNTKHRRSFLNGILDILSWPGWRRKSTHHRSIRKAYPQKLLEITDAHLGSKFVDHVFLLHFTPLQRSAPLPRIETTPTLS
jgi:hypothetical protein